MNKSLLLLLLLAVPASAVPKKLTAKTGTVNFRLAFELTAGDLAGTGNFVVSEGSQANYVYGGEKPYEFTNAKGTYVEFKKLALIVNCVVASADEKDTAAAECQFELSGPGIPDPASKLKVPAIQTFQYQTTFRARLGQSLDLVDQNDRKVRVTITRLD